MKVLSINKNDIFGGAAIAAYRLHNALMRHEVTSTLLVDCKTSDNSQVYLLSRKRSLEDLTSCFSYYLGLNYLNITSTGNILKNPWFKDADIINFHNLHGGFFNYLYIPKLSIEKPIVYSLHDMWSFTGHCASSLDCKRWKIGCGNCPYLDIYPKVKIDRTNFEWRLKNWVYSRSKIVVVTPSIWLQRRVKESILSRFETICIPHGLDLNLYSPLSTQVCREAIGIPKSKKVIMFGAQILSNSLKGGELLIKALENLPPSLKSDIVLICLGQGGEQLESILNISTISLGYIGGEATNVRWNKMDW